MDEQSRGDNRSFLFKKTIFFWKRFAQEHNFFEGDFFRKEIFKWQKNKREMIKTNFFWKSWRDGYFPNTQRLPENEMWKNVDAEAIFVENILRSSKDSDLSLKKEVQKKRRKTMIDLFTSNNRNSEISSCGDLNKWLFCKKSQFILFRNEHDWK